MFGGPLVIMDGTESLLRGMKLGHLIFLNKSTLYAVHSANHIYGNVLFEKSELSVLFLFVSNRINLAKPLWFPPAILELRNSELRTEIGGLRLEVNLGIQLVPIFSATRLFTG